MWELPRRVPPEVEEVVEEVEIVVDGGLTPWEAFMSMFRGGGGGGGGVGGSGGVGGGGSGCRGGDDEAEWIEGRGRGAGGGVENTVVHMEYLDGESSGMEETWIAPFEMENPWQDFSVIMNVRPDLDISIYICEWKMKQSIHSSTDQSIE